MYLKKYIYLLFPFLIFTEITIAQVNDARLWLTGGVEKKFSQKIYLQAKASLRLSENISEVGTYYGDLGIGYKLMKGLKTEVHYRYSGKKSVNNSYHIRHRYYADIYYKLKTNTPFSFTFKLRYQKQYSDVLTSESGHNASNIVREETTLNYKYKKYQPFIGTEVYYTTDNSGNYFSRIRYKAGTDYDIDKRNSLTIFYMIQQDINVKNPTRAFIIGLGYKYIL